MKRLIVILALATFGLCFSVPHAKAERNSSGGEGVRVTVVLSNPSFEEVYSGRGSVTTMSPTGYGFGRSPGPLSSEVAERECDDPAVQNRLKRVTNENEFTLLRRDASREARVAGARRERSLTFTPSEKAMVCLAYELRLRERTLNSITAYQLSGRNAFAILEANINKDPGLKRDPEVLEIYKQRIRGAWVAGATYPNQISAMLKRLNDSHGRTFDSGWRVSYSPRATSR